MAEYKLSTLWKQAFKTKGKDFSAERRLLEAAFDDLRRRVSLLVSTISKDMPHLTVHDISHVDALWWTASEIAGPSYPINPAEAFVLGGAFLLHDAAHCVAAYPGGIDEILSLSEWKDVAAKYEASGQAVVPGTPAFEMALFDVLRMMHPKQARQLPKISWKAPCDDTPHYLIQNDELRAAYSDVIGLIAESHWHSPHELEKLARYRINPPVILSSTPWSIDVLKLAILLRTADAAHIDAERAPRFLLALVQPGALSLVHWKFQSRLHQVKRDPTPARSDLLVSGSPFPAYEQDAWWMAYDAARLIDKELRASERLLLDFDRPRLAARSVAFSYSPESFARCVPADGWYPVDTGVKIGDIHQIVERFGGEKLYGRKAWAALRELLQNAVDAVHACRYLGGLSEQEGEIEVSIEEDEGNYWLHVSDTGVGMSRYVLTDVLLDFGRSLWRSTDVHSEWEGLASSGFEAIGQFGIGFFSVFMLGWHVRVTTRRFEAKQGENQWVLEFKEGIRKRAILREPHPNERLKRHGTKVSVLMTESRLSNLLEDRDRFGKAYRITLTQVCAKLAPAIDIDLYARKENKERELAVGSNDWLTLAPVALLKRVHPAFYEEVDKTKFGEWSHLTELITNDLQVGRCAVLPGRFHYGGEAVGVIKGLYAGEVTGMAGLFFSKQQEDLARQTTIPDASLVDISKWAEAQKIQLITQNKLDTEHSQALALFGSRRTSLVIGNLGGYAINYEDLVNKLTQMSILVVHDDYISHEDYDDVLRWEFENHFEVATNVLEIESWDAPGWLDRIEGEQSLRDTWSLEALLQSAIEEAWKDNEQRDEEEVVGNVYSTAIKRQCRVITRMPHPPTE